MLRFQRLCGRDRCEEEAYADELASAVGSTDQWQRVVIRADPLKESRQSAFDVQDQMSQASHVTR